VYVQRTHAQLDLPEVVTNDPRLYGWGEVTLEWHTGCVAGAIEDIATLLVGEDPQCIEHLGQMMHRQHFWHASGVVRASAMRARHR